MRLPVNHALPLAALVLLTGCLSGTGSGEHQGRPRAVPVAASGPAADYPVVLGEPFTIEGVTYTPSDKLNYDAVGYAAASAEGGTHISIAHKTLPVPSYAEVTALDSGKTILVRVERRGPMNNDRIVELSPGAAEQLGLSGADNAAIRIRRVNPPEVERAMLRSGNKAPSRMDTPQSLLAVLRRKLNPSVAASPMPVATGLPPVTQASASPTPAPQVQATPTPASAAPPGARTSQRPRKVQVATASPSAQPQISPTPKPAPQDVPAATSAPGRYVVQVAAFSIAENAHKAATGTGGSAIQAGRLWRVRMGPFATRAEATAAQLKAKAAGFPEARIESAD